MKIWLNGNIVDEYEARVSVFDRSYLHGEGAFETLRCYNGAPAFLKQHLQRLLKTANILGLPFHLNESDLKKAIQELLSANEMKNAIVRFTLSGVGTEFGVGRPEKMPTNLSIYAVTINIDPKLYQTGVKVVLIENFINDHLQIAGIKSTSYLTKMIARAKASKTHAYEALLKNREGYWVEGSRTSFFLVKNGTLFTAPLSDGILPGITRQNVLDIAVAEKILFHETHITTEDLQTADEIFLCGSGTEIMPVSEVIDLCTKQMEPNSLTQKIHMHYNRLKLHPLHMHLT